MPGSVEVKGGQARMFGILAELEARQTAAHKSRDHNNCCSSFWLINRLIDKHFKSPYCFQAIQVIETSYKTLVAPSVS